MKNTLLNLLYSFCIILLLVFSAITYHNNNVLENRINSLTKNSNNFSSEKSFKEDYYIKQLDRDTTLLLVVFPILVGFVSLFTFANVVQKLGATKTEIENKIKEKETEWDKNHSLILELKARIDLDSSHNSFSQSSYFFHEKDFEYYITSFLDGVKYKVYHHIWLSDKFPETTDIVEKEVISHLKRFLNKIDEIEIPNNLSNFQLTELIKEIRKVKNDEVDNLLSIIYSKLITINND